MGLAQTLNLVGLLFITVGSICAARAAPAPVVGPDGKTSLGDPDLAKRIAAHHRQKHFGKFLGLIAVGAVLQAIAIFVPSGCGC